MPFNLLVKIKSEKRINGIPLFLSPINLSATYSVHYHSPLLSTDTFRVSLADINHASISDTDFMNSRTKLL